MDSSRKESVRWRSVWCSWERSRGGGIADAPPGRDRQRRWKFGVGGRPSPNKSRIKVEAASGTEIEHYGNRKLSSKADGVLRGCNMEFVVTDVPSISVIVDAGNEIVFAKGSFVRIFETVAKIHLRRQWRTYKMEVSVDAVGAVGDRLG